MKLYVTFTSPYARLARILIVEKVLQDRAEIIEAKTVLQAVHIIRSIRRAACRTIDSRISHGNATGIYPCPSAAVSSPGKSSVTR
jgi:hypothetical protein